jgi:hypothetical protein
MFLNFGDNNKTTVNPLRKILVSCGGIFFAIGGGGGIKKNFHFFTQDFPAFFFVGYRSFFYLRCLKLNRL